MIFIAFVIALSISHKFENFLYPLVVAWASAAIWVAHHEQSTLVGAFGMTTCVLLVIWVLVNKKVQKI